MNQEIPAALRFPGPPDDDGDESIADHVRAILAWRDRVEHALRNERAALPQHLTDRAVALMLRILTPTPSEPAPLYSSPYRLRPFPAPVAPDRQGQDELMKWRAGFSDFLADIWDVINTPAYNHRECGAMRRFLRPPDADRRCSSCLALLPEQQRHESRHVCPMFAYITANWPDFKQRAATSRSHASPADQNNADRFAAVLASSPPFDGLSILAFVIGVVLGIFALAAPASAPRLLVAGLGLAMVIVSALIHNGKHRR